VFLEGEEVRGGLLRGKKSEERLEKDEEKKKEKRKKEKEERVFSLPLQYDLVCIQVGTPSQFDLIVAPA
jgi:hypothetical protein